MTSSEKDKGLPLTPKQAAFIDLVIAGDNQTQAYKKAYNWQGTSKKALGIEASRLMHQPHVKARYDQLKKNTSTVKKSQQKLFKEWIISKLKLEANDPHNAASVRVRALEILAKTEGLFSDSPTVTVQHRTPEEIERELKERLTTLFGNDHDITLVK